MPDLLQAVFMFTLSVGTLLYTTWWGLIFVFVPERWKAQELKKLDKKHGPDPTHDWLAESLVNFSGWSCIIVSSIIGARLVAAFLVALEQTTGP